jgi:hypothetical protein
VSGTDGNLRQEDNGIPRRGLVTAAVIVLSLLIGAAISFASWLLRSANPWWSGMLANLALAAFLLIPGELALRWVTSRVERVSETVRVGVEAAQGAADRAEKSLGDVRKLLLDKQHEEHEASLDVYRKVERDLSRDSLIDALRQATEAEIITATGVRVPVWETDLHYRFVLNGPTEELEVRLESDDGAVVSSHQWSPSLSVDGFLQVLVDAVRSAGRDLGVGLNDPTQSVQDLIGMLIEVAKYRAQELKGYRDTLHKIIERVDGWYFTERAVIPADNLRYAVPVSRLDDMDWDEHLRGKGWYGASLALHFARALYGLDRSDGDLAEPEDAVE